MEQSFEIAGKHLHLLVGDLTEMATDAIVNAANEHLVMGGGVAGAIRTKGGPTIQEECNRIGGTFVGGAVITNAGTLKAKKVIHAVGPRMGEGNEDEKLRQATRNSLRLAEEKGLASIAFPAISTGIFGYPMDRCAQIMLRESIDHLKSGGKIQDIYFCLWQAKDYDIFLATAKELLSRQNP